MCLFIELEGSLSATQGTLEAVYCQPSMNKTAYQLHAVLVHQGQASRGHYWAYVRKKKNSNSKEIEDKTDPLEMSQEETKDGEEEKRIVEEGEKEGVDMEVDQNDVICSPLSYETQTPPSVMDTTDHAPLEEEVWLKYNDVSVTEVDWEEVKRESFGGTSNTTSAYCLVYISTDAENKWTEKG